AGIPQDPGGDGGPLVSAATKTAAIGVGDIDVFTIPGDAGGTLMATIAETTAGSALTSEIELYTPAGELLTFANNATGTAFNERNLPVNGNYTIVVRDLSGTGTGGYAVTPVSLGADIAQDRGGDGGLIDSGAARTAAIDA